MNDLCYRPLFTATPHEKQGAAGRWLHITGSTDSKYQKAQEAGGLSSGQCPDTGQMNAQKYYKSSCLLFIRLYSQYLWAFLGSIHYYQKS